MAGRAVPDCSRPYQNMPRCAKLCQVVHCKQQWQWVTSGGRSKAARGLSAPAGRVCPAVPGRELLPPSPLPPRLPVGVYGEGWQPGGAWLGLRPQLGPHIQGGVGDGRAQGCTILSSTGE